jgi:hypothetical protein
MAASAAKLEKLTAAVRYWELAAEFFEFRAQEKRLS